MPLRKEKNKRKNTSFCILISMESQKKSAKIIISQRLKINMLGFLLELTKERKKLKRMSFLHILISILKSKNMHLRKFYSHFRSKIFVYCSQ